MNDQKLRKMYHLPYTRIETDSYIAVQLLQAKTRLDTENIRFMAEKVDGSFAFSIVDTNNTLWLVRGDSPLSLVHLPKYKLYVYASTDEILFKALVGTVLFEEIKRGNFEEIEINSGDIFKITTDGVLTKDKFKYTDSSLWERCNWWTYGMSDKLDGYEAYINDLKSVVTYLGYSPDDVDKMLQSGFSPEEIEDFISAFFVSVFLIFEKATAESLIAHTQVPIQSIKKIGFISIKNFIIVKLNKGVNLIPYDKIKYKNNHAAPFKRLCQKLSEDVAKDIKLCELLKRFVTYEVNFELL